MSSGANPIRSRHINKGGIEGRQFLSSDAVHSGAVIAEYPIAAGNSARWMWLIQCILNGEWAPPFDSQTGFRAIINSSCILTFWRQTLIPWLSMLNAPNSTTTGQINRWLPNSPIVPRTGMEFANQLANWAINLGPTKVIGNEL